MQHVGPVLANVSVLSPNVNSSKVVSTASRPRMTLWPVTNPIESTAGSSG